MCRMRWRTRRPARAAPGYAHVERAAIGFLRRFIALLAQVKAIIHRAVKVCDQCLGRRPFVRNQAAHAHHLAKEEGVLLRKLHTAPVALIMHRRAHTNPCRSSTSSSCRTWHKLSRYKPRRHRLDHFLRAGGQRSVHESADEDQRIPPLGAVDVQRARVLGDALKGTCKRRPRARSSGCRAGTPGWIPAA